MGNISKYGFIRVASASPELRVADVEFNTEKIIEAINISKANDCHLIVFPELCITGYTCGDLFFQSALQESVKSALEKIIGASTGIGVIVGAPLKTDSRLFNTAVFISGGRINGIVPKLFLCNSNEYYEERWFASAADGLSQKLKILGNEVPFGTDLLFKIDDSECIIGMELCEDLWSVFPPSFHAASAGANLLFNLSASDEYLGKSAYRDELVKSQSARCIAGYVYSSAGPGESSTDLVFAGKCIIAEDGHILAESEKYNFDTQIIFADIDIQKLENERVKNNSFSSSSTDKKFRIVDIELPASNAKVLRRPISTTPFVPGNPLERASNCKEIFEIQSTGLAKRIKHMGIKDVVIGISGGLDSTLALLVCIRAFNKIGLELKGILAISMPGFGTTNRTKNNAEKLAELLGTGFKNISIENSVKSHFIDINHDSENYNIVFENSQARERTQILMDISNQVNGIVIGTGDLSEIALGWSTYNGDHMSMYGVNSGVPKTLVRYIIEWCAEEEYSGTTSEILKDICNTPISPELLPADENGSITQKTEQSIGPYILHDFFLYYAVRWGFSPDKILFLARQVFDKKYSKKEISKWLEVFYQRFFSQQFKRSCMPDGVKVGTVAFSPRGDWRMPSDASGKIWQALC